jgi:hypothetical protein
MPSDIDSLKELPFQVDQKMGSRPMSWRVDGKE